MRTIRTRTVTAAAMLLALAASACGVSVEADVATEEAATAADGLSPSPTEEDPEPSTPPADEGAETSDPDSDPEESDTATDDAPGDDVATDDPTEPGPEAIQIAYALPGADSPEAIALGRLVATPVESCVEIFLPQVPAGAQVNAGPQVTNNAEHLELKCFLSDQGHGPLIVGTLSLSPTAREDTEVQISGNTQSLQQGHLTAEINTYGNDHPANPTAALRAVLADTLVIEPDPLIEPQAPAALAHDPATRYTQPGRNSEEVIRLYWMTKDPFTSCQHLLGDTLPPDAELNTNARANYNQETLSLHCSVSTEGFNLTFITVAAVVHEPTTTEVTEPFGTLGETGLQRGHVVIAARTGDERIDLPALLPHWQDALAEFTL